MRKTKRSNSPPSGGEWSETEVGVAQVGVVAQRRPPGRRSRPGRGTSPRPGRRRRARCARSARPAARSARCGHVAGAAGPWSGRSPAAPGRATARPAAAGAAGRQAPDRGRASAARRRRADGRGACAVGRAARRAGRPRRGTAGVRPVARHSPPSRRFSSTVSSLITPRPSGTCAMPRRTSCSTGVPRSSSPASTTWPAVGRIMPESVRSSVVLPAPLAPTTAAIVPAAP